MAKALKGFADLKYFTITTNTAASYVPAANGTALIGARSCSGGDTRKDYKIPGDNGIYRQGSDYESTSLKINVNEMELADLGIMLGATFADTVLSETELDAAPELALSFSALDIDYGYRLFQYFNCKLTSYKVDIKAKLDTGTDVNQYELNFICIGRLLDGLVRATKHVAINEAITWLDTILGATKYTVTYGKGTGTSGTDPAVVSHTVGEQVITLANPYLKTDNHFTGWLSNGAGTPTYDESHAFTMPAANITLTAQWAAD